MSSFPAHVRDVLPEDAGVASLAGRVWRPDMGGPSVVAIRDGAVLDMSATFPTMRDLCETADPAAALRAADGETIGTVDGACWRTPRGGARPRAALAAGADRPAGDQGGGGDVRRSRCSSG